jgi:hypothetical protein
MWPRARRRWIREQGLLDPAKLAFLDETAVTTTMVRLRGRAPRGTRVIGVGFRLEREDNHLHSSNAARQNDCADGIRSSSSDNCRPHTSPRVRKVIEKARATLRYLPKYSFDLNPIEMAYSKFKEFLRSVEARTVPAIYRAIRLFLPSLSAEECANYLRHAGDVSI